MISITSFYRFIPLSLDQFKTIQARLEQLASHENLRGLCLVASEGINATVSGDAQALERLKSMVRSLLGVQDIVFKDSVGQRHPFQVFKVKIKNEIVTLGNPSLTPHQQSNGHLSPKEWQHALKQPDTVVLDTRNKYEIEIGRFKNSVDLQLHEFNQFPEKLKSSGLDKNKKVLMYCTGGIRCEKAILEMQNQGFENVFQLDGGILNYLNEYPDQDFAGECFVFDYRVALDQELRPSEKYRLCPHCGGPANRKIQCLKCSREELICGHCQEQGNLTCSKNCAHHLTIGSNSSKPHLPELKRRRRT